MSLIICFQLLENTPDVQIKCAQDLEQFPNTKGNEFTWEFKLKHKEGLQLKCVSLLNNYDRLHFSLKGANVPSGGQLAEGDSFLVISSKPPKYYKVCVEFRGGMFGSFSQTVAFDFGTRPITIRKINVEVGKREVQERVKKLRQKLGFDLWSPQNRHVVFFCDEDTDRYKKSFSGKLHDKYSVPSAAEVANQRSIGVELNQNNYVHKMKKMLQLEELTQAHMISG